jgi:putative transposase
LLVPYQRTALRRELALYVGWYNGQRPHDALDGATPDEIYFDRMPACRKPRFEPRRSWPRGSPCAGPKTAIRGRRGRGLDLEVSYLAGRKHLPIVELKRAA